MLFFSSNIIIFYNPISKTCKNIKRSIKPQQVSFIKILCIKVFPLSVSSLTPVCFSFHVLTSIFLVRVHSLFRNLVYRFSLTITRLPHSSLLILLVKQISLDTFSNETLTQLLHCVYQLYAHAFTMGLIICFCTKIAHLWVQM